MISIDSKVALILGHPGHELRVHRFLEMYKPRVYVLTDGSGAAEKSRVYNTLRIIEKAGATASPVMGRFTDAEIYRIIRQQDRECISDVLEEIMADMKAHQIDALAGDAVEGYNPTHDLCRYMINAIAGIYGRKGGSGIPNYEFLLDGPPHECPPELINEAIRIKLNDEDFARKFIAACNYPEIMQEVERVIRIHGKLPFQIECLWPVKDLSKYTNWSTEEPYYEVWGKEKVRTGEYAEIISYQSHLLPLAEFLTKYSKEHEGAHHKHMA